MKYFILFLSLFFLSAHHVFAQDFDSILNVTYTFDQNGVCQVTNEVSIINNVDNLYVSEYTITLKSDSYTNFIAYDKKGTISPSIDKKNDTTTIRLKFNDSVIGKGQINTFIYRYQTKEFVTVLGSNKEIRLPKNDQITNYIGYSVTIKVPNDYGSLSSSSPKPNLVDQQKNQLVINYSKSDDLKNGIYLLFGEYQIYQVDYQVELVNNHSGYIKTSFPLIPDTPYQKTFQDNITPLPVEVSTDADGNWLAYYVLRANEKLSVTGTSYVKVMPKNTTKTLYSPENLNAYLASTDFWPVTNPEITAITKDLKSIDDIYNYVVHKLAYDYDEISLNRRRNGALFAINQPEKSVCTEYTDLFITLARSMGIPAREHEGYAFSQDQKIKKLYENTDILHAWPEYYDKIDEVWVMVDPTFGDTSGGIDYLHNFDNSHITFVVHGLNDKQPAPLGSYKPSVDSQKQIKVTIKEINDLPSLKPSSLDLSNITTSFSLDNLFINIIRGNKLKQGPFFTLINQPIAFNVTNTSGYPLTTNVKGTGGLTLPTMDPNIVMLPWQKFVISGSIKPEEKYRRYYYQGALLLNAEAISFSLPVVSSMALIFYTLIIIGTLLFSWLLYRIYYKRSKHRIP